MTDYTKLIDDVIDYNASDERPRAALQSAIEALAAERDQLQAENERLKEEAKQWQGLSELSLGMAEAHSKERNALQSHLDAMGKGEPVATVTDNFATDYSEISRTYQAPIPIGTKLYAAPKALEPQSDDSDVNQVHEGNAQVTYAPIFYGASAPKEPTP